MEGRFTVEKMVCSELRRLGTIVFRRLCCTFGLARVRLTMKMINACKYHLITLCPWPHRRNTFFNVLSLWHISDNCKCFRKYHFTMTCNLFVLLRFLSWPYKTPQSPYSEIPKTFELWPKDLVERWCVAKTECVFRRTWTKLLRVNIQFNVKKVWYFTLNLIYYELTRRFMSEIDITMMKVKQIKRARSGMGISFSTK